MLDRLRDGEGVLAYDRPTGAPATVQLDDPGRVPDLVAGLAAAGVRLTRVEPHTPTLEDLYFAVRGLKREERTALGGVGVPASARSRGWGPGGEKGTAA